MHRLSEDFRSEVREKIRHKPRLTPVFSSVFDIPERLYEYHPRLFICHNCVTGKFEVHSLDQEESFCAELPYRALDARTLRWVWQNDIRVHGRKIFERFDRSEEQFQAAKEREFKNWIRDVASETRSLFAKDAWLFGT